MEESKALLIEELRHDYQLVKEQLIFAESKNVALMAFNIALLAILLQSDTMKIANYLASIGLATSCLIGFFSFAPLSYSVKKIKKIDKDNQSIIYFRNIAIYSVDDYLSNLCKEIGLPIATFRSFKLAKSYAEEICIISRITVIKNRSFSIAMRISVIVLLAVTIFFFSYQVISLIDFQKIIAVLFP